MSRSDPSAPAKLVIEVLRVFNESNSRAAAFAAASAAFPALDWPDADWRAGVLGEAALVAARSVAVAAGAPVATTGVAAGALFDVVASFESGAVAALTASRTPPVQSVAEDKATVVTTRRIEPMKNSVRALLILCRST